MIVIGHRGARGLAPENTVAAIEKAIDHHVDQIEVDLRVTDMADEKIVILHHDDKLSEPNGTKHTIATSTYTELRRIKPDLATLDELFMSLQSCKDTQLYLEVKPGVPIQPIVVVIEAYLHDGFKPENILLGSKSQKILRALHRVLPNHPKIVIESWSGVRATHRARQVDTKLLAMNQRWLWRGFIRPMAKRGWQLSAYTLNDPVKARRWKKYGLYGVITDYPDRFQSGEQ